MAVSSGLFERSCQDDQNLPSSDWTPLSLGSLSPSSTCESPSCCASHEPLSMLCARYWTSMKLSRTRWYCDTSTPVPIWPFGGYVNGVSQYQQVHDDIDVNSIVKGSWTHEQDGLGRSTPSASPATAAIRTRQVLSSWQDISVTQDTATRQAHIRRGAAAR